MDVALVPALDEKEDLRLELNISTTLGISALQAKRKVARFFMDEVSMFIGPNPPLLIVAGEGQIFWRFPIIFAMGLPGQPYPVGEVDVDAFTGNLVIDDEQLEVMKTNARQQAISTRTPLPTVG